MISKITQFVKAHMNDIILVIGVILISLISFGLGYLTAIEKEKVPIEFNEIIYESSNSWCWYKWAISSS